jgi:hypothetical protein
MRNSVPWTNGSARNHEIPIPLTNESVYEL